ncbi:hypothetical protein SD77_0979 [Bacillus badius]|uniref:Secreted protein n=1 Tax=Bacillus badius TaxID=1455 RepID=A0ABR5ATQ5_BACBA|nr:hypothetical protein SD78_2506 [Bacillus badius]KIL78000.1 hypothetical protein SD77_0979 [Bacillus badius]KZR58408.1 hypothetical protein A3781_17620 [Bacillus badius]
MTFWAGPFSSLKRALFASVRAVPAGASAFLPISREKSSHFLHQFLFSSRMGQHFFLIKGLFHEFPADCS